MMVGPQIMSAVIFVTTPSAVRVSLGFLGGVAVATAAGVALTWGLAAALGSAVDLGNRDDNGSGGKIIQYVLVGLLAASMAKNWFGRATAEPPKWLGTLMPADLKKAFKVGLLVILLMPSDIVIMLTVGVHLEQSDSGYAPALPFIALTILVAAIPLLAPDPVPPAGRIRRAGGAGVGRHSWLAHQHHRLRDLHRPDPHLRQAHIPA